MRVWAKLRGFKNRRTVSKNHKNTKKKKEKKPTEKTVRNMKLNGYILVGLKEGIRVEKPENNFRNLRKNRQSNK